MIRKSMAVFALMLGEVVISRADSDTFVAVRILDEGSLRGGPLLPHAKAIARSILASAGIRVRWDRSKATPEPFRGGCAADGSAMTIAVRFSEKAPDGYTKGALAAATPFANGGIGIVVFVEGLRPSMEMTTRPEFLLGHVLAHEIGHKLLQTDAHASTGLMKARWSQSEVRGMSFKPMEFTPEHAAHMREILESRCPLMAARLSVN